MDDDGEEVDEDEVMEDPRVEEDDIDEDEDEDDNNPVVFTDAELDENEERMNRIK